MNRKARVVILGGGTSGLAAASLFLDSHNAVRALAKDIGVPLVPSPYTKGGYIYRKGDSHSIKAGSSVKQRIQTTCIGLPHCARLNFPSLHGRQV